MQEAAEQRLPVSLLLSLLPAGMDGRMNVMFMAKAYLRKASKALVIVT
jgi:hypothetical protein